MNGITLREYRAGDWEAMYALDVACFEPPFRFSRRAMRGFAEAPGAVAVLAEADGKLTGFCVAEVGQRAGYLVTLDVAPAFRRQGLARRLMNEMEAKVRAAGRLGMALHVFTGNVGAIKFYEAMDYAKVGTAQDFYGRGLDALAYRKKW